jgi:hypothetical protein
LIGGMAARRAARAATSCSARGPADPDRPRPERLGRERPDPRSACVSVSLGCASGAASSACDDIVDRDSIPAGRISQIAPRT